MSQHKDPPSPFNCLQKWSVRFVYRKKKSRTYSVHFQP